MHNLIVEKGIRMIWLQKIYILFLNPLHWISKKIDSNLKLKLSRIIIFALSSLPFIWYTLVGYGHILTLLSRMLVAVLGIALLIFFSLDEEIAIRKLNKVYAWLWFLLGTTIFSIGFISRQNPGYWMSGPVMAIGFPCLYFAIGKKDKIEAFIDKLTKSIAIVTLIYITITIFSVYLKGHVRSGHRLDGLTFDSNRLGELCIIGFCVGLYLLKKHDKFWYKFAVILTGAVVGIAYLTQSRTAVLSIALISVYFIICFTKDNLKLNRGHVFTVIIIIIIAVITVFVTEYIHNQYYKQELGSQINKSNVGVYVEEKRTTINRITPEKGETVDAYSSGRFDIWKGYSKHFKLLGNERVIERPVLKSHPNIYNSHNNLIEITYRSGYLAGMFYLLIELYLGVYILKGIFKKNEDEELMASMIGIGFLIFSNLMPAYNPITTAIFFAFMLFQIPIFQKEF